MEILIGIVILIFSIIIHEVAHGYAAEALGDPTARYAGRLTLNPIPHVDPIGSIVLPIITSLSGGFIFGWAKPVPYNPYNLRHGTWGEALVALAGPASNLILAIIFAILYRLFGSSGAGELFMLIVFVNVSLAIFNLIPIPPLDGSKILFAFLPWRWLPIRAFLERWGMLLVFAVVLLPGKFLAVFVLYISAFLLGVGGSLGAM